MITEKTCTEEGLLKSNTPFNKKLLLAKIQYPYYDWLRLLN